MYGTCGRIDNKADFDFDFDFDMSDIYGTQTQIWQILITELNHLACDGSNNKIMFRSCEEFDNFTENQLISFDQQAMHI